MANQKVGSIYEVALNDVGYKLADNPQRQVRRQTGVLDTQAPGSDDPLSERIGRYDLVASSDWTGGEGQELLDRPTSDPTRFFRSELLSAFNPGQISCLHDVAQHISSTFTTGITSSKPWAVVTDDGVFVQTAA